MANQLAKETSPYLLQHKDNPVAWYAWGPEALARAKRENKPIFLSIGYAACHWCHVMERESFENPQIAAQLNAQFVSVKVDREERPDLDHIYMNALHIYLQMINSPQGGGWPLSMFLTPDLEPILGGTYWPPVAGYGRPGFGDVLRQVATIWQENPEQAVQQARHLTEHLQGRAKPKAGSDVLSERLLWAAGAALERTFDAQYGGFGGAPKFPHPMALSLLLRLWRRSTRADDAARLTTPPEPSAGSPAAPRSLPGDSLDMVHVTLGKMAAGGIYDHLGGGFARYAVDQRWLVPHFEKMLYDNALLAGVYLDAYLATGDDDYARVVRETLDYARRDMTDPAGGFYSTEDADSEGEEGKFYVWTPAELVEVLGPDAAEAFATVYDVTEAGNFEGKNILNRPRSLVDCAGRLAERRPGPTDQAETGAAAAALSRRGNSGRDAKQLAAALAMSRRALLAARNRRVRPGRDDKVLVSWNGLMIGAMARAGGALGEPAYLDAATKAVDFILTNLRRPDGRLLHTWRRGVAKLDAYLDDYACLIDAMVSVYEAGFEERLIDEAVALADMVLEYFVDRHEGGFCYTASDHERLIARHQDILDGSVPSASAMAATALLRLGKLGGVPRYVEVAVRAMGGAAEIMQTVPAAAGQMLLALDMYLEPTLQLVLLGDPEDAEVGAVLADLRGRFIPNKLVAARPARGKPSSALDPLFEGKESRGPGPTLYVCEDFACQAPVSGKDHILARFDALEQGNRI